MFKILNNSTYGVGLTDTKKVTYNADGSVKSFTFDFIGDKYDNIFDLLEYAITISKRHKVYVRTRYRLMKIDTLIYRNDKYYIREEKRNKMDRLIKKYDDLCEYYKQLSDSIFFAVTQKKSDFDKTYKKVIVKMNENQK